MIENPHIIHPRVISPREQDRRNALIVPADWESAEINYKDLQYTKHYNTEETGGAFHAQQ